MRYILLVTILTLAFTAGSAVAADFVPIAPIPGESGGLATDSTDLSSYINSLFRLALAAGAVLAAILIAIGGFEYIFSEAMEGKKDGRVRIQQALTGLALLILVYLILYIINPDIVSLQIFR